MFPAAYYGERYFGARYWPTVSAPVATDGGGYFPRNYFAGTYFAPRYWPGLGAETPVDGVPLELCCATTESLNPVRTVESLARSRSLTSLNPRRTLEQICECP